MVDRVKVEPKDSQAQSKAKKKATSSKPKAKKTPPQYYRMARHNAREWSLIECRNGKEIVLKTNLKNIIQRWYLKLVEGQPFEPRH